MAVTIMKKLKQHKKIIIKHIKKIKKLLDKNIIFSAGENCLADDILARNGLKSFSSPYSSGRSNIEYILAFEKEAFSDFLNQKYLKYESFGDRQLPRNKKYVAVKNHYHNTCLNGFEFAHHDVISSEINRKTFKRRCQRLLRLRQKNIIILYHHRLCAETDESLLISHLIDLANIYKSRNNDVHMFMFSQVIVSNDDQRKVEHTVNRGVNVYKFYTINEWAGDNQDIFWARYDEDLLTKMIADIKEKMV